MEVLGQKVVTLAGVWMCEGTYYLRLKVEAFEMHLSDNAECHRKCPAFLDFDALDDNK